jgi:hypothetical protein
MTDRKVWLITGEQKARTLLAQAGACRDLSGSLAYDDT